MEHYIGPNGELYHAAKKSGWVKEDHKYIKREWKNGKWVYTYPSDVKNKSLTVKKTISKTDAVVTKQNKNSSAKSKTTDSQKNQVKTFLDQLKDRLGFDEKEAYENAKKQSMATAGKQVAETVNGNTKAADKYAQQLKQDEFNESLKRAAYDKTTLGKIDKVGDVLDGVKRGLSDVGDLMSKKLSDIGDDITDFGEDVVDWVGDRVDDLHDATIGKVTDALGYDERDAMYEAQKNFDRADEKVSDTMERFTRRLSPNTDADSVDTTATTLKYDCADWAAAEAEYAYAKAKYDASVIGRVENWINGEKTKPPSDKEIEFLRLAARHMQVDSNIASREGEYLANRLLDNIVTDYAVTDYRVDSDDPVWSSTDRVRDEGNKAYYDLLRYMSYSDDSAYGYDMQYIEMDRIERVRKELENRYRPNR